MRGIELALKLCIQTEWAAAADLVGVPQEHKELLGGVGGKSNKPLIRGLERPLFVAPCGGARMQLLTQISRIHFSMYPTAASPLLGRPNFMQDVATNADDMGADDERGRDEKRKRDGYLDEWAAVPGNDATMSTAEVDRHRKVRFVERITNAITDTKAASENIFEGLDVDNMSDAEIDSLLGRVLVSYVEMVEEKSGDANELRTEINFCGYAGLSFSTMRAFTTSRI